ncbi:MAG: DNA alkylation repair protein [Candidatus Pacebacteria bacterium]|nr:DNA alkylation repair protein [Candidatus Paceibacterota bacterium]
MLNNNKNTNIISKIRKELKSEVDIQYKIGVKRYFKKPIKIYGVRTPIVRKIANKYFPKNLNKKELFKICEILLKSDYCEESTIAFQWLFKIKNQYSISDFIIFENLLKKYVNNWSKCDDFCTHSFGSLIYQYPELLPKVLKWTKSPNHWLRRVSAVILIHPIQKDDKKILKNVFQTAKILLQDKDDLVQKGYGWMLKVASDHWQKEVFNFVMENKKKMPRTALRYAIEKMPKNLKERAMK